MTLELGSRYRVRGAAGKHEREGAEGVLVEMNNLDAQGKELAPYAPVLEFAEGDRQHVELADLEAA